MDAGRSAGQVLDGARPKPHFSRKASLERQLRGWTDEALSLALERLQLAVADSRKNYAMQEPIARRVLLGVSMLAVDR